MVYVEPLEVKDTSEVFTIIDDDLFLRTWYISMKVSENGKTSEVYYSIEKDSKIHR